MKLHFTLLVFISCLSCVANSNSTQDTETDADTTSQSQTHNASYDIELQNETVSTESDLQLTWSEVITAKSYTIAVSSSNNCKQVDFEIQNVETTTLDIRISSVGEYLICVTAFDESHGPILTIQKEVSVLINEAPPLPTGLSFSQHVSSLTSSPTISWDVAPNADHSFYEVSIGTSQGATDILAWHNVGDVTEVSFDSLTLQNAKNYYVSLRSTDKSGSTSSVLEGTNWQNLICPAGYVKVHGNETPGLGGSYYPSGTKSVYSGGTREISDFCVMQFEAQDGGSSTAASVSGGSPWTNILVDSAGIDNDAKDYCNNIGSDYALINNAQWQAIAREIESVNSNWFNNDPSATTSYINLGKNIGFPCPTTQEYVNSSDCNADLSQTFARKRTHTLSSGEKIWDFSGNVWEYVLGARDPVNDASSDGYGGTGNILSNPYNDEEGASGSNQLMFGPVGAYSSHNVNNAGLGFFFNVSNDTMLRGGSYSSSSNSGIFSVLAVSAAGNMDPEIGFRCVYAP